MVDCPVTGSHLYFVEKDGKINPLTSYGECERCGMDVHESALFLPPGTDTSRYTIVWEGRWCKDCWASD